MEEIKHVQVRLTESEYGEWQQHLKRAGFSSSQTAGRQVLLEAMRGVVDEKGRSIPSRLVPYREKLAVILGSGNAGAIKTFTGLIDFLYDRLGAEGVGG